MTEFLGLGAGSGHRRPFEECRAVVLPTKP
jgi:hypothetical protein